jgi:RHS repeat-associated protein
MIATTSSDLKNRNYTYNFHFNGKENNDEVSGIGNTIDYGDRVYNSRLGRFLSVDPLEKAFPMLSTYQYAANSPISNIDLDGREAENFAFGLKKMLLGVTSLQMNNLNTVVGEIQQQYYRINIGNPEKSVDQLYSQIANDINSIYGTGQGSFSFEEQQSTGKISSGDYVSIDPGLKGFDMAVKVTDVQMYDNNKQGVDVQHKGFSITFRTLEGHVETGLITFTALQLTNPQTGATSIEFSISSTSQIDNGIGGLLPFNYARNLQQAVWHQVMKNVAGYTGGEIISANQRIDKYSPSQFNAVDNNETTLGSPEQGASPVSEYSELDCY